MSRQHVVRVGVFFDGTGNNQVNATADAGLAGAGGSHGNARSNVALLHALYPCGLVDGQVFLKLYVQGIGTTEGAPDSMYAQATGCGDTGVEARVEQALLSVGEQLRSFAHIEPAGVEFDLFGFSRGAAAARHFANRLQNGAPGLPLELRGDRALNFIGLFDTVAAFVAPLKGDFNPSNSRYHGVRLGLGKGLARQVIQLVAGDEQRHNFPLVRTDDDIVVPGVHSNIGGGYPALVQEKVLLCKPLSNRVALTTPVERTRAYAAASTLLGSAFAGLAQPLPRLISWEVPVEGSKARRDDPQKQVFAAVYREREVSGHLSRVYLSVMRELAVRSGVPFAPLGDDEAHWLPEELQMISRKLHDFALGRSSQVGLTADEQALLQARYVHTSAHWNAVKGLQNSALDVMYIDRPAEGGRVMHENAAC